MQISTGTYSVSVFSAIVLVSLHYSSSHLSKMAKSIAQVQGTNDYSSTSKRSMVQRGYFEDIYVNFFVEKCSRRSPLINVGYCIRSKIMNFILEKFLKEVLEQPAQIISFGAGFDTSFFRLLDAGWLHPGASYYEIDFQMVVERKAVIIEANEILLQAVGDLHCDKPAGVSLCSDRYCLIGCNLQDLESLENILKDSGANFSIPTLCLAECSITYMDEASSTALIKWAASKFEHGIFATYEQVYPHDAFGIVMAEHFKSLNSPLLSLESFPDLKSQEERYKAQGWTACVARAVTDVFMHITDHKERFHVFSLEPFDEFEELHLKCVHYTLTVASKDSQDKLLSEMRNIPQASGQAVNILDGDGIELRKDGRCVSSELWRFSHRTARLKQSDGYVVVGGVGMPPDGKHKRRTEVGLLNLSGSHTVSIPEDAAIRLDVMYHTCTTLPDGRVVVLGGRTSPSLAVNTQPVTLVPCKSPSCDALTLEAKVIELSIKEGEDVRKARWRHTSVVVSVDGCCYMLIFGGRTSSLEVLDDLWVLDILVTKSAWQVKPADGSPWPDARCSHGAVACGTSGMVVVGGLGRNLIPLDDVWQLEGCTMTWHKHDVVMLPRYGHTTHFTRNSVILVGGVNTLAGKQPGIAVINTVDWTCLEYALPDQNPRRPLMLHNHSTELCDEDSILVVGGGGNCFSFGTAFNKNLYLINFRKLL